MGERVTSFFMTMCVFTHLKVSEYTRTGTFTTPVLVLTPVVSSCWDDGRRGSFPSCFSTSILFVLFTMNTHRSLALVTTRKALIQVGLFVLSFVSLLQGQGGEEAFTVEREWGKAVEAEGITQGSAKSQTPNHSLLQEMQPMDWLESTGGCWETGVSRDPTIKIFLVTRRVCA